jgi:hypothetical protein
MNIHEAKQQPNGTLFKQPNHTTIWMVRNDNLIAIVNGTVDFANFELEIIKDVPPSEHKPESTYITSLRLWL